ncbi:MAG: hypothetical protein HRU41_41475 [Saprospiraceae bacterium]|nr:hypothetical protein [Saprospiraceae bacterium]
MNAEQLSPEQSLELITEVIKEAKSRFEENGVIYCMWGAILAFAALLQYGLLKSGQEEISYYGYFIVPIGALISWYYYARKKASRKNQVSSNISITWGVVSMNLMILGFFFNYVLQENLTPLMLILMGIGTTISGGLIKSRLILFSGLFLNAAGFLCFQLNWLEHPLVLGISAILFILVPGLLLMIKHKGNNV